RYISSTCSTLRPTSSMARVSDTKFNLFNSRRIDAIDVSGVRKHGEGE
ncbi:hypothetical protein PUR47_13690, partial [Klebsiella pneumoniae]|nr:hypothetical protein [Klebsiella pneumoniae]